MGMVLIPVSCTMSQTSVHSSSGTLSVRSRPLNLSHFHCIIIRDFIQVIPEWSSGFPTFFNLSLNLAIRSSWSEPQSAPGLVLVDCIELLHLWLQKYNQSDFGVDHLVMSMCKVISCVVQRGHLLWPVHSLGKTPLAFALLHFAL